MAERTAGLLLPGVADRHVHLGLVDREALADSPVVRVDDLGWSLAEAMSWRADPPRGVAVGIAGPFHTAIGGYPAGRAWAPAAAVVQLEGPGAAVDAVRSLASSAPIAIKIALNAGMPLLDDRTLEALVTAAHEAGLPAAVHAEGAGQAERAIRAGADVLVHVPWTTRLDAATLREASRMTWISTLAIHHGVDLERALANARGFLEAGGSLRYGTDMGNGPTPVGVNAREIELLGLAGLAGRALREAVLAGPPVLASPLGMPATAEDLVSWLAASRRVDIDR